MLSQQREGDGKASMVVGRMERQLRRGPIMAAVVEMANTPLPRPNRHSCEVEEVEENTAKLWTNWPTCFCSGERARRWRSSVGNGGAAVALSLRAVEAKEM